jgi:hypothetical protein
MDVEGTISTTHDRKPTGNIDTELNGSLSNWTDNLDIKAVFLIDGFTTYLG